MTSRGHHFKTFPGGQIRTSSGGQFRTSPGWSNRIFKGRPGKVVEGRPRDLLGTSWGAIFAAWVFYPKLKFLANHKGRILQAIKLKVSVMSKKFR